MSDANKRRSIHRQQVALAATSTALTEAREAVNHFALRCTDPHTKGLMVFFLDQHLASMKRLRCRLSNLIP